MYHRFSTSRACMPSMPKRVAKRKNNRFTAKYIFPRKLTTMPLLRVSIDGLGYIGLVEVTSNTTMKQLRMLLQQTFDIDTLPPFYQFLLPSGNTVGMRKESRTLAVSQSSITLLPTAESPLAGASNIRSGVFTWCPPSRTSPNEHPHYFMTQYPFGYDCGMIAPNFVFGRCPPPR